MIVMVRERKRVKEEKEGKVNEKWTEREREGVGGRKKERARERKIFNVFE